MFWRKDETDDEGGSYTRLVADPRRWPSQPHASVLGQCDGSDEGEQGFGWIWAKDARGERHVGRGCCWCTRLTSNWAYRWAPEQVGPHLLRLLRRSTQKACGR